LHYLTNRFRRVRELNTIGGYGPPYVLDIKNYVLRPFEGWNSPWWKSKVTGRWWHFPTERRIPLRLLHDDLGMAVFGNSVRYPRWNLLGTSAGSTPTNVALDSNYVNGTGGDAISMRFQPQEAHTLDTIYFFISSYTGTAANVNDIDGELRTGTQTAPTNGAPGLVEAARTVNPASATGWIQVTGFTSALTAGTVYWAIVGDPDGGITDLANVTSRYDYDSQDLFPMQQFTSTNGFTTAPTAGTTPPCIVLKFSNGDAAGMPFANTATYTIGTNQRGLYITSFDVQTTIYMISSQTASNNLSGAQIWQGTDGPSGTTFGETTTLANSTAVGGALFLSPFPSLAAATAYRIVWTVSGAVVAPTKAAIGTGTDATLRSAMKGKGNMYWTNANAGVWADDINGMPLMGIYIDDFVVAAGGGGPIMI